MAARIQVEVGERILHRVEVADLPGEIEHELGALDRRGDLPIVADVRGQNLDGACRTLDVAGIAAVAWHERIDHPDLGSRPGECECEVRADEAQAAGDDAAAAREGRRPFEGGRGDPDRHGTPRRHRPGQGCGRLAHGIIRRLEMRTASIRSPAAETARIPSRAEAGARPRSRPAAANTGKQTDT